MELVLTHVNSELQPYIQYQFKQIRVFNPDIKVSIVGHEQYLSKQTMGWLSEYNINFVPYEQFADDEDVKEFLACSWYHNWDKPNTRYPSPPIFVQGTSERLYALNAYCKKEKLTEIFHVENDVLIYEDLTKLLPIIKSCYTKMVITPMADKDHTFAFVYIPSYTDLDTFCKFNTAQMKRGNEVLLKEFNFDMINEMAIVKIYKDLYNGVDFFPTLPYGQYSENLDKFNSLFDPASWGQYIGGTNNYGNNLQYAGSHHIIGREILAGSCTASMQSVNGLNIPHVHSAQANTKLNNLHIHSKHLELFLS
jgi:hypothetical protein